MLRHGPHRRLGDRVRARLALGRGDQVLEEAPAGRDRESSRAPRRPRPAPRSGSLASWAKPSRTPSIPAVAGRGGQRDPLDAQLGVRRAPRSISRRRPRGRSCAAFHSPASLRASRSRAAAACGPGRSACVDQLGHERRPSRGSLHLLEDVVGRPAAARGRAGRARLARAAAATSRRWIRQARPRYLLSAVAGRSGVPAGDERLVAIDREVRRQRRRCRPCRPARGRASPIERAVEELGQVSRSRASRAPGRGPRDTSGPGRPRTRSASCRASPTLSVGQVAERQDQLAADAGVGVVGQRRAACRDARARPAAAWPRASCIRRWPFSRQSRPSMRTACSRIRGSPWLTAGDQRGHRDRVALDRVPDPEGAGPVDRVVARGRRQLADVAATFGVLAPRDQAPPGRVLGGDVRRLERGDQPVDGARSRP